MNNRSEPATNGGQLRWAIVGLCAALVFAGGAIWWTQRGEAAPSPSSPAPSLGETPTEPVATTPNTVQPADGCLGGPDPEKAVLVAHDTAPLTGDGAAAFLAAYIRWHYLAPKTAPVEPITSEVWATDLVEESKDLPTNAGLQEKGLVSFAVTMRDRHYRVDEFDGQLARVSLTLDVVDPSGVVTANAGMIAFAKVVDGKWVFAGRDDPAMQEADGDDNGGAFRDVLDRTGIPFQEAC